VLEVATHSGYITPIKNVREAKHGSMAPRELSGRTSGAYVARDSWTRFTV
jgi:hypothetical protein